MYLSLSHPFLQIPTLTPYLVLQSLVILILFVSQKHGQNPLPPLHNLSNVHLLITHSVTLRETPQIRTDIGGGTGFLIREPFKQLPTSLPQFISFESSSVTLKTSSLCVTCLQYLSSSRSSKPFSVLLDASKHLYFPKIFIHKITNEYNIRAGCQKGHRPIKLAT